MVAKNEVEVNLACLKKNKNTNVDRLNELEKKKKKVGNEIRKAQWTDQKQIMYIIKTFLAHNLPK